MNRECTSLGQFRKSAAPFETVVNLAFSKTWFRSVCSCFIASTNSLDSRFLTSYLNLASEWIIKIQYDRHFSTLAYLFRQEPCASTYTSHIRGHCMRWSCAAISARLSSHYTATAEHHRAKHLALPTHLTPLMTCLTPSR